MPRYDASVGNGRLVSNYGDLVFEDPLGKSTDIIGLENKIYSIVELALNKAKEKDPKNLSLGWVLALEEEANVDAKANRELKRALTAKPKGGITHTEFAEFAEFFNGGKKIHALPKLHSLITAYTADTNFFRKLNADSYTPSVTPETFTYPLSFLGLYEAMSMVGTDATIHQKYVEENAPLFRVVTDYPNIEQQQQTGKRFMFGSLASFSLSHGAAETSMNQKGRTIFVLQNLFSNLRNDDYWIYIAEHSVFPHQLEILVSPLMKFVIEKPPTYFDPANPTAITKKKTPKNFVFISPSLPK